MNLLIIATFIKVMGMKKVTIAIAILTIVALLFMVIFIVKSICDITMGNKEKVTVAEA
ncbi:hypothetical protein ACFQ9Y_11455 [Peribacillus simplex]|uniref:hypothetical protein n=1 Tax=Peribacillus simplex TaxID=1478 RepID=UPI00366C8CF5